MLFQDGVILGLSQKESSIKFKELELDILRHFSRKNTRLRGNNFDYRGFGPVKLWDYISKIQDEIEKQKGLENFEPKARKKYLKARYLLHQRMGMPFATIIFALFGLVLSIQDDRRGKGSAYVGSLIYYRPVATSYGDELSSSWPRRAIISAPLGVWVPNLLMLGFASFPGVPEGPRLPASRSTLDPKYFPWIFEVLRHDKKGL